jgi:hypothetical protein
LEFFETIVVDPDASVEAIREEAGRQAREAEALAERAEAEVAEVEEQRQRVDRDYRRDALSAEDYGRLITAIDEEQAAAEAEAEHHRSRTQGLAAEVDLFNAEFEWADRLVRLRKTVAGEINDAASVEALRAAITTLCDFVELREDEDGAVHLVPHIDDEILDEVGALRLPDTSPETKEPDHMIAAWRGTAGTFSTTRRRPQPTRASPTERSRSSSATCGYRPATDRSRSPSSCTAAPGRPSTT